MSLARYKISEKDFPKAIKFLNKEKGIYKKDTPNWVVKNEKFLQVVNGKVRFNDKEIVPLEHTQKYLRNLLFNKDSRTPMSRDGAFHLLKQKVAGISRRTIMSFLQAQSVVVEGKGAVPVPKGGGKKVKNYEIEFDLVFLKKRDVVNANKYFEDNTQLDGDDEKNKELTYIVSVVEKVTGLTRLDWVKSKHAAKVTPIVVRLMKSLASSLKTSLKTIEVTSDSGTEFAQKMIEKEVKTYKRVPTGPSVEKKNSDIQRVLFQLLRARRGKSITGLIKATEGIVNNNFNRITKKTPNESVDEEKEKTLKKYNDKRRAGEEGKKLEIGDYVRIRVLKTQKDKGLAYKSYKNMLWTKRVFRISAKTKNVPAKYRVNKRWLLTGMLMKVRPTDEKSEEIIKTRDKKQRAQKDAEQAALFKKIEKEIADKKRKEEARKKREELARKKREEEEKKEVQQPGRRRSRRAGAIQGREKRLASMKEDARIAKGLREGTIY
jgi:hypothetical protein